MMRRLSLLGAGRRPRRAALSLPGRIGQWAHARADKPRPVVRVSRGAEASEGQGLRLTRLIGTPELDMLDPFLLLDWFAADAGWRQPVGFPDHPHLGIEAVTYVVSGALHHTDNRDNDEVVEAGGVQWMTASGGIVNAEFADLRAEPLCGYQLWINLPAREKRKPPSYRAFAAGDLPVEERPGAEIVVIAGTTSGGLPGVVTGGPTDPLFLAARLEPDAGLSEDVSGNAFFVVHDGAVSSFDRNGGSLTVGAGEVAILGPGTHVQVVAGPDGAELLLAAAMPIGEPVARAGPIVMNTRAEALAALRDYREGRL